MSTPGRGDGATPGGDRPVNPFVPPSGRPVPPSATPPFGDYGPAPNAGRGSASYPGVDVPASTRPDPPPPLFPGTEDVDSAAVLGGDGYMSRPAGNEPLAVAAIALGLLAVIPGVGLIAVLCGHLALRRLERSYLGGRGLAVAGLVLGYALTALWVLLFLGAWAMRDL